MLFVPLIHYHSGTRFSPLDINQCLARFAGASQLIRNPSETGKVWERPWPVAHQQIVVEPVHSYVRMSHRSRTRLSITTLQRFHGALDCGIHHVLPRVKKRTGQAYKVRSTRRANPRFYPRRLGRHHPSPPPLVLQLETHPCGEGTRETTTGLCPFFNFCTLPTNNQLISTTHHHQTNKPEDG